MERHFAWRYNDTGPIKDICGFCSCKDLLSVPSGEIECDRARAGIGGTSLQLRGSYLRYVIEDLTSMPTGSRPASSHAVFHISHL